MTSKLLNHQFMTTDVQHSVPDFNAIDIEAEMMTKEQQLQQSSFASSKYTKIRTFYMVFFYVISTQDWWIRVQYAATTPTASTTEWCHAVGAKSFSGEQFDRTIPIDV